MHRSLIASHPVIILRWVMSAGPCVGVQRQRAHQSYTLNKVLHAGLGKPWVGKWQPKYLESDLPCWQRGNAGREVNVNLKIWGSFDTTLASLILKRDIHFEFQCEMPILAGCLLLTLCEWKSLFASVQIQTGKYFPVAADQGSQETSRN